MPAPLGIADVCIAGMARSYAARVSLVVVPVCGENVTCFTNILTVNR